jgi:uncharacterized UPF0146 family protein
VKDADRTTALADALLAGTTQADGKLGDEEHDRDGELRVVEVAIGERTAIAESIAGRGAVVRATDVVERSVPEPIEFRIDDLLNPQPALFRSADLLYALRLPPELHDAFAQLAADVDVPAAFTTLGGDPPTVATTPEQVPGGETIHWIQRVTGEATGAERGR